MHAYMIIETVFMHDPIRFLAVRGAALVENKGLPHPDSPGVAVDDFIAAGGLPEAGGGGAIGARPGGVLLVFVAEEIPVILRGRPNSALFCSNPNIL